MELQARLSRARVAAAGVAVILLIEMASNWVDFTSHRGRLFEVLSVIYSVTAPVATALGIWLAHNLDLRSWYGRCMAGGAVSIAGLGLAVSQDHIRALAEAFGVPPELSWVFVGLFTVLGIMLLAFAIHEIDAARQLTDPVPAWRPRAIALASELRPTTSSMATNANGSRTELVDSAKPKDRLAQVAELAAAGRTQQEIAELVGVSVRTVRRDLKEVAQ